MMNVDFSHNSQYFTEVEGGMHWVCVFCQKGGGGGSRLYDLVLFLIILL